MTDWDKELAKIDKQLASISDEELMKSAQPTAPAKPGVTGAVAPKALPAARASAPSASPSAAAAGKPWLVWAKVLVAVGAAAGLMYWPWPARCGTPLIGFTAATGGVALLGLWSAVGTWRHRLGWAHIASLLVIAWGLALGAREVLPRVGYAVPSAERPAQWSCDGLTTLPATTPEGVNGAQPGPLPPAGEQPAPPAGTSSPPPVTGGTTL